MVAELYMVSEHWYILPQVFFLLLVLNPLFEDESDTTIQIDPVTQVNPVLIWANSIIDHNDPLFLQPTDTPSITLIAIQIIGTENYALWSRYMKIALFGKNKSGFIDGSYVWSLYLGALLNRWEQCNAIVLSWLMNVVSKESMTGIASVSDSHRVWENLKEKFDKENSVISFHLHKEIAFLAQCSLSTSVYFSKLSDLWDEFDSLISPPTCNCETSKTFSELVLTEKTDL